MMTEMRMAEPNPLFALSLFEDFMKICHGESRNFGQMKDRISDSEEFGLPDFWQDQSLFTAYNQILMIHICSLPQLEYYLDILEQYFTPGHWAQLEKVEEITLMIEGMLERVKASGEDQEDRQEIEQVRRAMQSIAGNLVPSSEYPHIEEKLEAEYWMKFCQTESLPQQMEEFLLFIEQLLESLYASPKLRMFWNDVKDNDIIRFRKPGKKELLYYMCAELRLHLLYSPL